MEVISIIIQSDRNEIRKIEKKLEELNAQLQIDPQKFVNLQIAASEALVNAIVHGNKENGNRKVHVKIEYDALKISMKVKDEGKGFNPESLPDPTKDENLLKESGRGIFIIKSLVDEFECKTGEDGTTLIFGIYI